MQQQLLTQTDGRRVRSASRFGCFIRAAQRLGLRLVLGPFGPDEVPLGIGGR
jgi:hypothetical protein